MASSCCCDFGWRGGGGGGGGPGEPLVIRYNITTSSASSVTVIPAGAVPLYTLVQITTAYTAGTTMKIGETAGTLDLLMATTDIDPTILGTYEVTNINVNWGAAATARATITGAPVAGAATVEIWYVTSVQP